MENIRKWTDEKLDKELAFARGAVDQQDARTVRWLDRLDREAHRRNPEGLPFSARRVAHR